MVSRRQVPSPLQLSHFRSQLKRFVEFTDEEWSVFAEHLYLRRLKKKDLFASREKICNEVGFIYSGSLRFYFVKDGVELSNYFCFQNELISSYRSFLKQAPGGMNIEAMEPVELVCFSSASLQALLADDRTAFKMERFGRTIAEYLICCYDERLLSFLTQSAEQRYSALLAQQPQLLQKIPQRHLASYLGITPVSLSRIRKRMFSRTGSQKKAS